MEVTFARGIEVARTAESLLATFRRFCRVTESGCIEWTGSRIRGYGNIGVGYIGKRGVARAAHRVAYELLVGPIEDGMTLDHLCRNRCCVNPAHLEPVSSLENYERGLAARGGRKTHCPQGHEYTDENTYRWRYTRNCKICRRANERARNARRCQQEQVA